MAIFEKTIQTKAIIDDTENLSCTLENAQNINKHTEYVLRVERGSTKEDKWKVNRRYRDFAALHSILMQSHLDLPLPPKKFIGNMHPSFIAERQIALQHYINEVLKYQILALSLHVRSFLDPSNYPSNLTDQSLQTVSIALRGDGRYELKGLVPHIGWRIRKHYFLVTETKSGTNCLLSWQTYGRDRHLCDKDLQTAFKCLQSLSHPHIDQILASHSLESGAYVVRKLREEGCIRDMLYNTQYNTNYLSKYANPKLRKPFTEGQIAHYGLQILQTLKFLHDKGLPHGHIHPGNITIENQKVLLLDIENNLLGVACVYRPYILELKKTTSCEAVDVYCFGRTLYEMAFAETLKETSCDFYPCEISDNLQYVLRLCLSTTSCKHGMPSLDLLLKTPFFTTPLPFSDGLLVPQGKPHLKFPSTLKEELENGKAVVETRLKTEQKMLRGARREVRIQEILGSEEEMRKQVRKAKKRNSLWKSASTSSSLAETVHSQSVSTASSPTPPSLPTETSPPSNGALLNAICNFDKSRLTRINSR